MLFKVDGPHKSVSVFYTDTLGIIIIFTVGVVFIIDTNGGGTISDGSQKLHLICMLPCISMYSDIKYVRATP